MKQSLIPFFLSASNGAAKIIFPFPSNGFTLFWRQRYHDSAILLFILAWSNMPSRTKRCQTSLLDGSTISIYPSPNNLIASDNINIRFFYKKFLLKTNGFQEEFVITANSSCPSRSGRLLLPLPVLHGSPRRLSFGLCGRLRLQILLRRLSYICRTAL